MDFSAEKSSRKLDIGTLDRRVAAMVTAAALVLWTAAPANAREARLPLVPRPQPQILYQTFR